MIEDLRRNELYGVERSAGHLEETDLESERQILDFCIQYPESDCIRNPESFHSKNGVVGRFRCRGITNPV